MGLDRSTSVQSEMGNGRRTAGYARKQEDVEASGANNRRMLKAIETSAFRMT